MAPDSISSVENTKDKIVSVLDVLVKTTSNKNEIKEFVIKINDAISEPSEWFNAEVEFVLDMADKLLFERIFDEKKEIQISEQLMK